MGVWRWIFWQNKVLTEVSVNQSIVARLSEIKLRVDCRGTFGLNNRHHAYDFASDVEIIAFRQKSIFGIFPLWLNCAWFWLMNELAKRGLRITGVCSEY